MKRVLLIVFLFLIPIALADTMQPLDEKDYEGRKITLLGVQDSKILIQINDEKAIVELNKKKTVNGVEILVTEVFDSGDLSSAEITFGLSYVCGDSQCDEFETSENCCQDCGCSNSLKCVKNACLQPECTLDTQCNDNNPLTNDYCSDFKCKHREIRCDSDSDCNDNNPDTDDTCYKGNCRNFLNYVCKTDEDCIDDNPCTTDSCINKDCQNILKENCKEPEKTLLEEQQEEIKNNLEEDVIKFRESILKRIANWFRGLF